MSRSEEIFIYFFSDLEVGCKSKSVEVKGNKFSLVFFLDYLSFIPKE